MNKKGYQFLGLMITERHINQISENRTRMVLKTLKGDEYAVYRDTHNGVETVYANWRNGNLEGKEKEQALKAFNVKK
jgi:regulator of PEP synthase PpsR (kinase-PPPase family)